MKSLTSLTPNLDLVSEFIKETGDNPVQAVLRSVLAVWGDDMSGWCRGQLDNGKGQHCAWGALDKVVGTHTFGTPEFQLMDRAAREMGFTGGLTYCSNSGPENARKMVLRAISLSA